MAVKAPTPPTPPAPPAVPGVTLQEGGAVTQSNAPPANGTTSRSTDNEKQMEEQAKSAVAQGSGGLSRTTNKNLTEEAREAKAAAQKSGQEGREQAKSAVETGRDQAAQASMLNNSSSAAQNTGQQDKQGQETTAAAVQGDSLPQSLDYHGIAYWVPLLVLGVVIGSLLVKKFLHRQGRQGELTKADLDNDALGVAESRELRGLTPDEVLARLEEKEKEPSKPVAAKTQVAMAQVRQSYSQKPATKAKNKAKAEMSVPKKPPKTKAGPRQVHKEEERQRFEVRI